MSGQVMPTYARMPVTFERGEGAWLWSTDGTRYFDAISGIAVCNLGHAHPDVARAICDQASKLVHTSNLYGIELQERLASELVNLSGLENVFFCNSGAEANEAALKLARKFGHAKGVSHPKVVVMENSFHGRTLFTLSATGNAKVQEGFGPLVEGFVRVPYGDTAAIESLQDDSIVAVLVEPVQGEGGVRVPPADFLPALRRICDVRGWLLMLDEVQSGMARTGAWFGFQHSGILPDVMTLAKALGNGVPIGACIAGSAAAHVLTAGKHGSTFGGNPLACRAALAVLQTMRREELPARAAALGSQIQQRLREAFAAHPNVVEVRGKGLMIGIELDRPCAELTSLALARGFLINVTADKVIRLLPPLIMTDGEAQHLVDGVVSLVSDFTAH